MPSTSKKILEQIGADDAALSTFDSLDTFGASSPTLTVKKGEVLFPRIDLKKELAELEAAKK